MKKFLTVTIAIFFGAFCSSLQAQTAPSTYSAYSGTDTKVIPPAPALGPANSVFNDPTFGSRILRVTDANTSAGESFIPSDAGFFRTWNANSTAIKLNGPTGDGYWLEFNPSTFKVGDGSSRPTLHPVPFGATGATWEWSTVDPDVIYFLNGNQIAKYNKATGVTTNLGGPSTGEPVRYMAVVIGQDNWVCSAAGAGIQDTYTKIFCINPVSPTVTKFIDVVNKTINGQLQGDPNWPLAAAGQVLGIHAISGGTGASWLQVSFHQQSWGANGDTVFNMDTNTWSLITNADYYWSGHLSMGNGKLANSSGSINGSDSRGMVMRDPNNLMNSAAYSFIEQPPDTLNGWCDADHSSWLNSMTNPGAPILISRYSAVSPCKFAWSDEIVAAAVDGTNKVWRFAHNHNGGLVCFYGQSTAQISNDGKWALFSSYWDGTLGPDTSFGCNTRIDTFIVDLSGSGLPAPPPPNTTISVEETDPSITYSGSWFPEYYNFLSGGSGTQAMDAGSRATFKFNGVAASWMGYQDEWSGIANVYVDGVLKGQVDTYASPSKSLQTLYSITGLTPGTHTLTIEATGTHNSSSGGSWIWVDGFKYTTAPATVHVEETDPSIAYSGSWFTNSMAVHSGGSAVLAMDKNTQATFTFTGSAVTWIGYQDQWSGIANVYVDGVLAKKVDTYSATSKAQQKIFTVSGLTLRQHTLKIVVTQTKRGVSSGYWVWIDAFEYTTTP
jgi:hypothetical protein